MSQASRRRLIPVFGITQRPLWLRPLGALLLTAIALGCSEGDPQTTAAASGISADRPYRDAALAAAGWLRSVAVETEDGVAWPVDPDGEGLVVDDLYHGNAGVVLFFVELAHATGDETALDTARRGADHLLGTLPETVEPYQSGLYTGVAGVGYVLARVAVETGDARYRRGAERVVALLRERAESVGEGIQWDPVTDIIRGSAGTGLFLLYAGRALENPDATGLAAAAGRRLLELAKPAEGGSRWSMQPDFPRVMPNFSHGTAGIAYFLASLYIETGDQAFLDAALAGARHLLEIADITATSCLIHHHTPGGEDLFYLSWCHGPAGTGRLFYRLYQATGEEEWLGWLERTAAAVVESGIPGKRTPGFWNNVGQCCGSAGVAAFLLAVDRVLGVERHRELVRRLTDDVLARATRAESGLKWIQAEHRVKPELLVAQTGFMQGASGIGLVLLDLDAVHHGGPPIAPLPDSPFQ